MRSLIVTVVLLTISGCAAYHDRLAISEIAEGKVLSEIGVARESVKVQAPCKVALKGIQPLSCIIVQTVDCLYFLKYDENLKSYKFFLNLTNKEISGVALVNYGLNRQIQLHSRNPVLAFHVMGSTFVDFVDTDTTVKIYGQLLKEGIGVVPGESWINLVPRSPTTITIPVHVGR